MESSLIIQSSINFLLSVALTIAVYRLLYVLFVGSKIIFRSDAQARLFVLGFSLLLFSKTVIVHHLIILPITLTLKSFSELIQVLASDAKDLEGLNITIIPLQEYFYNFPVITFLFFLSFLILAGKVLETVMDNGGRVDSTTKKNLALNYLIIVILLGSFLTAVSVLISIPYLDNLRTETFPPAGTLDTALRQIPVADRKQQLDQIQLAKSPVLSDPEIDTLISRENLPVALQEVRKLKDWNKHVEQRRSNFIKAFTQFIQLYDTKREGLRKGYVSSYTAIERDILVDKNDFFRTSLDLYTSYVTSYESYMSTAMENLKDNDLSVMKENRLKLDDLRQNRFDTTETYQDDQFIYYEWFNPTYLNNYNYVIPEIRTGEDWKFFGLIARPLIQTKSYDLILIVGMLGFGLFGASIASFARIDKRHYSTGNLMETLRTRMIIDDFWAIVIRGVSAAILIYLATKSGMAVFTGTSTTQNANGYVLLFSCLVGAVYSEQIWDKIKSRFANENNSNGPKPPEPTGG